MPKVSIVIPVYNSEKTVGEALDSVLAQTHTDYEVIVVNDGSTDNSEAVIRRYVTAGTGDITCVTQKNKGAAAARNAGIRIAKGELIAFLDADDLWFPTFLNQSIKAITDYGSIGSISLSKPLLSPGLSTKFIIKIKLLSLIRDCLQSLFYVFNRQQMPQSSFYLCQVSHLLFKSGVIKDLKFDTAYNFGGEDWKYVLEAMDRGFITIIPKRLVKYRYHPQSSIQNPINQKNKWRSYQQLFKELKRRNVNDFMTKLFGYYVKSFSK